MPKIDKSFKESIDLPVSILYQKKRTRTFTKTFTEKGFLKTLEVVIRYDDHLKNGHNTFSITGSVYSGNKSNPEICGCIHDTIKEHFPEFKRAIDFHLVSSDGPLHYFENVCFLAGNKDCWGRAPGDVSSYFHGVRIGNSPITDEFSVKFLDWLDESIKFNKSVLKSNPDYIKFEPIQVSIGTVSRFTFKHCPEDSYSSAPFKTLEEAKEFSEAFNTLPFQRVKYPLEYSTGKKQEFDSARKIAVWPEATDEELSLPQDELCVLLKNRLPALMTEFKSIVESFHFVY